MARNIAKGAAWFLLVVIVGLTLGPPAIRPVTGFDRSMEHIAAFALLGFAFGIAYPNLRMLLAIIGVVSAALMETLQMLAPGRHAYFNDFMLNAVGAWTGLVGAGLFGWLRQRCCR